MLLEDFILIRRTGCHRGRLRSPREVLTLRIGWTHGRSLRSYYVEAAPIVDRLQPTRLAHPGRTSAKRRALDRIGCGEPPGCSPKTLRRLLDDGLLIDQGGEVRRDGPRDLHGAELRDAAAGPLLVVLGCRLHRRRDGRVRGRTGGAAVTSSNLTYKNGGALTPPLSEIPSPATLPGSGAPRGSHAEQHLSRTCDRHGEAA